MAEELKGSGLENRHYAKGAVLLTEGEKGDEAFFIEKGRVSVFCTVGGQKYVIGELAPGSIVGEMALIDSAPRMASAVALESTTVRVIPQKAIERELRKSDAFVRAMLTTLVQNVRELNARTLALQSQKAGGGG